MRKIEQLSDDDLRFMIDDELVAAHRQRALTPDKPVLRGTAQNPDVFFQAREACNGFYTACPEIVEKTMDRFAERTGRAYKLFDYVGHPQAERVIVMMGSGAEVAHETVEHLVARGEKVGVLKVRLFRPFSVKHFAAALPKTVRAIAVLDRTKEPGSIGEPLYLDVVTALREAREAGLSSLSVDPLVIGGRYGLSSKEFNPAQVKAVFDELVRREGPRNHFTVGIVDDVTHTSLPVDPDFDIDSDERVRAVFFGLGADGTVGANKNSIKIIGEETENDAQGYFVYDSKKSGAITISHLRFGPGPIRSSYLIKKANFVACHQFGFLERYDMLDYAVAGRHLPAELALRQGRGLEEPAARGAGADHREEAQVLRDRRLQGRRGDGHGQPHQHHDADLLLRDLRRAAARGGDRPDQEGDREDLRQEGRGGRQAQLRRRRRDAREPARDHGRPASTSSIQMLADRARGRAGLREARRRP